MQMNFLLPNLWKTLDFPKRLFLQFETESGSDFVRMCNPVNLPTKSPDESLKT